MEVLEREMSTKPTFMSRRVSEEGGEEMLRTGALTDWLTDWQHAAIFI